MKKPLQQHESIYRDAFTPKRSNDRWGKLNQIFALSLDNLHLGKGY